MLIFVAIAFVGVLCVMAGLSGLQEGSADAAEIGFNLGLGVLTIVGVGYAFLARRKPRPKTTPPGDDRGATK